MVARHDPRPSWACEDHSGMCADIRSISSDINRVRLKLDRIEKLLLLLSMSVGAMAAAVGVSGDVAAKFAAAIAGVP